MSDLLPIYHITEYAHCRNKKIIVYNNSQLMKKIWRC